VEKVKEKRAGEKREEKETSSRGHAGLRGPCAEPLKLQPCEEGRWRQRTNTHG
jgi:hypothetical protein